MTGTRAYLDHAATAPTRPAAIEAMAAEFACLGNASSQHTAGRAARRRLEERRESIAALVGAGPSEVLFTSGGTESDNIGVLGLYRARREADDRCRRVLVGATEHAAVVESVSHLQVREGAEVTWLPCDADGVISREVVQAAVEADGGPATVALVAVMWANNEVGAVSPLPQIGAYLDEVGVPLHTDAVQALGKVPVDFATSGATTLAFSGHKLGGPVGIGLLLARRDAPLPMMSFGGGQERRIRSGTLPGGLVAGLEAALAQALGDVPAEAAALGARRDRLIAGAQAAVPGLIVSGPWAPGDVSARTAGNAHFLVPGVDSDSLLFLLDAAGVECSTGSACHAGVPQPSHVLLAMGYTEEQARGALRITLGHTTTDADVDHFLAVLPEAVQRAQRAHRSAAPHRVAT